MPSVRQADSLWIDYDAPNWSIIDDTWGNWTGVYEISATESSSPLVTGNLSKSATSGIFQLRLNSSNSSWTALPVGKYKLMIQISNSSVGYREERIDSLTIRTQGIS